MILWHVGATVWLFRLVFRDPAADLRFLAFGAVLPDIIEWAGGWSVLASGSDSTRLLGHSLAFVAALMITTLIATGRGTGSRRLALLVLVGTILHLALDVRWLIPDLLFWPALGIDLPPGIKTDWAGFPSSFLNQPLAILGEVVGLVYLAWRLTGGSSRSRFTSSSDLSGE